MAAAQVQDRGVEPKDDRAAVQIHDLGVYLKKNAQGEVVASILAGGGLGRTPIIGAVIKEDLPWQHLLTYCEAVLRVPVTAAATTCTRRASRSS